MTKNEAMAKLIELFDQEAHISHHNEVKYLEASLLVKYISEDTYRSKFFSEIEQWVMSYGLEITFQGDALYFYRKGREYQYDIVEGIELLVTEIESEIASQAQ